MTRSGWAERSPGHSVREFPGGKAFGHSQNMLRTYVRKRAPSYREGKLFDALRTGNWASWDGAEQTEIKCGISLDDQVAVRRH